MSPTHHSVKSLSGRIFRSVLAFTLVMLYALFENNTSVLEVADVSAALFAIIFIIVRIIAWHMRAKTSSKETK